MARKPAHIVAQITVRVPYGQDGVWQVIRELRTVTLGGLLERVEADRRTVSGYLERLERGGFIARGVDGAWSLTVDQADTPRLRPDGTPAREVGRGQENLWRSMKMLDRFSADDLARAASTPDVRVSAAAAASYAHRLHRAGYLTVEQPAARGRRGKAVYSLDPRMNTGPRAPMVQATDFIFDPNTRRVHGAAEGR
ncbi:hypothetical protein [Azospirillum halopraeferens]|uniref:hypothetical protein n=1 Tax=Azospirillum halopraeferens TaxID=34010 RepID=UPI000422E022|nr:hypothetical protein [Azospirillum halopraeferens]